MGTCYHGYSWQFTVRSLATQHPPSPPWIPSFCSPSVRIHHPIFPCFLCFLYLRLEAYSHHPTPPAPTVPAWSFSPRRLISGTPPPSVSLDSLVSFTEGLCAHAGVPVLLCVDLSSQTELSAVAQGSARPMWVFTEVFLMQGTKQPIITGAFCSVELFDYSVQVASYGD